jgi:hypothetical protein
VVEERHLQALADRIAGDVLALQLRSNKLTRYGEGHSGAVASAALMAGGIVATCGVLRRMTGHPDVLRAERLYALSVGVDRDRAHADVHYVSQRLQLLAMPLAVEQDLDELVRAAAPVLVAFVAAGRPSEQRLDEVEAVYAPLREALDDPRLEAGELLRAYLAAWRHALSR